jgi:hypothetical protein
MNKVIFIILSLIVTLPTFGSSFLDSVVREKWGELDVVWIEDSKFPRFTAVFHFQDGSLSEGIPGLTQGAFDQMTSGTSKESQREIAEFFDFYGANIRSSVTHEYSTFTIQALTKDLHPVMSKVCSIFTDAQYPQKELGSYISRSKSQLKNLVTSHASLADRIFRQVSLVETPYATPAEGTLSSFKKLNPIILKDRLEEINKSKKTLYLSGPDEVHHLQKIIAKECPWRNGVSQKSLELKKPNSQNVIYLVPVPGANQAQIRIGRYVTKEEIKDNPELLNTSYTDGPESFNIYIKINDMTICHRMFDAKVYPPKIRYTVDIRPHIKRLLTSLTDIFSSNELSFEYAEVKLDV